MIRDTEAIEHPGQYVTVEGTVVAVFTNNNGNTFLSFGAAYPNQTFGGWILADSELAHVSTPASLAGLAGKKAENYRHNRVLQGHTGNTDLFNETNTGR